MNDYELRVYDEVEVWKRKVRKRASLLNRISKTAQIKMNNLIPEKAHQVITESIKNMVKATLAGSNITTNKQLGTGLSLLEKDELVKSKLATYRKTAAVEGAGTGAGGFLLALADFPLLLSIKMKFLFDASSIYGFNPADYEERLFILHVFKLSFSSDDVRRETLTVIEEWEEQKVSLLDMDWRVFQQEYRDHIDFVKMLQMLPGVGAIVGAYANYNLLEHLGETAMNSYRLRIIKSSPKDD